MIYLTVVNFNRRVYESSDLAQWPPSFPVVWEDLDYVTDTLEEQCDLISIYLGEGEEAVTTSTAVELRGEEIQEPERRRIQQRPPSPPPPPSYPRPFHALEIEEAGSYIPKRPKNCKGCFTIHLLWGIVAASSLAIGLWRSFSTGDEGKGFTVAAYIFGVGGALVLQFQSGHKERCLVRGGGGDLGIEYFKRDICDMIKCESTNPQCFRNYNSQLHFRTPSIIKYRYISSSEIKRLPLTKITTNKSHPTYSNHYYGTFRPLRFHRRYFPLNCRNLSGQR